MIHSYLWLLLCVTLWGSNFVFGSILVQEFSPMTLAAIRISLTALVLLSYAVIRGKLVPLHYSDLKLLIPLAVMGTLVNQTAFFTGLQTTDATSAALILSLTPITTAVLAAIFLRETYTIRMMTGSVVALIGVFFVVGNGKGITLSNGIIFIFIAMLSFAVSIILIRKLTARLDPFIITVYMTVMGCALLVPSAFFLETNSKFSPNLWAWALMLGTGIVMQGICALIWNQQLQNVGAGKASVFLNLQPFVAMVVGFLLLGTMVSLTQLIGSVFIVCGVIIATTQSKIRQMVPAEQTEHKSVVSHR